MAISESELRRTHFSTGGTMGQIGHAHVFADTWRTSPTASKRTTLRRECECGHVQNWMEYAANVKARAKRRW